MDNPLDVSQIIASTIQGEGPYAGTRTALIRLAGCNLTCSACDEPHTWKPDPLQFVQLTADQILEKIKSVGIDPLRINHVLITGGEPLRQQRRGLQDLVDKILRSYRKVHIETNGTIVPDQWLQNLMDGTRDGHFNMVVSPKVSGPLATDRLSRRINARAITEFAERGIAFKFVCANEDDLEQVQEFVDIWQIRRRNVWIMGEGATIEQSNASLAKIATMAVDVGFNLSARLHLAAWQGGE